MGVYSDRDILFVFVILKGLRLLLASTSAHFRPGCVVVSSRAGCVFSVRYVAGFVLQEVTMFILKSKLFCSSRTKKKKSRADFCSFNYYLMSTATIT